MGIGNLHIPYTLWRHAERQRVPLTAYGDVGAAPVDPTLRVTGKELAFIGIELRTEELLVWSEHLVAYARVEDIIAVDFIIAAVAGSVPQMVIEHVARDIAKVLVPTRISPV